MTSEDLIELLEERPFVPLAFIFRMAELMSFVILKWQLWAGGRRPRCQAPTTRFPESG